MIKHQDLDIFSLVSQNP